MTKIRRRLTASALEVVLQVCLYRIHSHPLRLPLRELLKLAALLRLPPLADTGLR